ncbi:SURF1 family cytochrome oxidase biogenesis protein [Microbacterium xanthum]|uniref:SURF1 family cytochrome oxidase biogenesis protein n=1 Tax=Microbacterium xanthum TaxID=3079794 RepID=UPI002AD299A8|nr:SURF1 family protein [Microbacterium sp. KSW-48]MDZ8172646.1 SURF1 family protein [Microbacterium sp. KSW-48]
MTRRPAPAAVRWSGYAAIAIVFAIACAFLSHWQFERNASRATELALVERNYDAAPVTLSTLIPEGMEFDPEDEWHPVTETGRYLVDEQLLVRNRPHGGTAAFEVLVPFQLDDGRILIVDRGWVPPGESTREPDDIAGAPEGTVEITVRLRPGEPLTSSGQSLDDGQIPTINLPLVASVVSDGDRVEQSAYGALVSENPAPVTELGALDDPSEDPGPHLSYAIQWILFAIMGFVFIGYMIRTEVRARREDDEDDDTTRVTPERTRGRRRDRDADAEDALVDALG